MKAGLKHRGDARFKVLLTKIEIPIVDPEFAELERLRAGIKTVLSDGLYTPRLAEEELKAFRKYHCAFPKTFGPFPSMMYVKSSFVVAFR